MCCGIDWNIRSIVQNTDKPIIWNYKFINNKIFKNNIEINHSHLTILKCYKNFSGFYDSNFINKNIFNFNVIFKLKKNVKKYDFNQVKNNI
jgi:hypothetical protein